MKIAIYLVDDESTFRSQFKRAIKAAGFRQAEFEFHEFETTDKAVEAFRQTTEWPRLALFDQNVKSSRYRGTEAIRVIRESGDEESILGVISSSNKPEEIAEAKRVGARFWIRKGGGRASMISKMQRFKAEIFDKVVATRDVPEWLEIGLDG